MKKEAKKKWEKPKLIILTKGKPEEWVLQSCKTFPGMIGPDNAFASCFRVDLCANLRCDVLVTS
ncbi:MAG: hypothetical protein P9L93_02760 [Candidatus Gorgyraea atricola]|nr:hypothetical protein [Candidatus Gorgyraea atricola]